jgi:hypothetical protein
VTYDLSLTNAGVIQLSPFGTALSTAARNGHDLPGWLPQLPIGTPQVALLVAIILGLVALLIVVIRRGERTAVTTTTATERTPDSVG